MRKSKHGKDGHNMNGHHHKNNRALIQCSTPCWCSQLVFQIDRYRAISPHKPCHGDQEEPPLPALLLFCLSADPNRRSHRCLFANSSLPDATALTRWRDYSGSNRKGYLGSSRMALWSVHAAEGAAGGAKSNARCSIPSQPPSSTRLSE